MQGGCSRSARKSSFVDICKLLGLIHGSRINFVIFYQNCLIFLFFRKESIMWWRTNFVGFAISTDHLPFSHQPVCNCYQLYKKVLWRGSQNLQRSWQHWINSRHIIYRTTLTPIEMLLMILNAWWRLYNWKTLLTWRDISAWQLLELPLELG
jgi:hypothetical protein